MSEFINRAKIADLHHANAELSEEVENLKTELENLKVDKASDEGTDSDEINTLKETIYAYEQQESEFKGRLLSLSKELKNSSPKSDVMSRLLSVLSVAEVDTVEAAINQYYQLKWRPKIITSFLLGLLVAILCMITVIYLGNSQYYNEIIEHFKH